MKHLGRVLVLGLLSLAMMGSVSAGVQDGFEDGDFTSNPSWTTSETNGKFQITSNSPLSGTFSLLYDGNGNSGFSSSTIETSVSSVSQGDVFRLEVNQQKEKHNFLFRFKDSDGDVTGIQLHRNNNEFRTASKNNLIRSGYSLGTTYVLEMEFTGSNTIEARAFDNQGNLLGSNTETTSTDVSKVDTIQIFHSDQTTTGADTRIDDVTYLANNPPVFNSVSASPSPLLIGQTGDFSYNASDPDGSIQSVDLTLKDDGSTVFTGSKSTAKGTFSPSYSLTQGDITATFTATDNDGATATKTLTRTLVDNRGTLTVNSPSGSISNPERFFDYDVPVSVTHTDNDNNPNETITLEFDFVRDGDPGFTTDQTVNISEGETFTTSFRQEISDSNEFRVRFNDQTQTNPDTNVDNFFNVTDFEITGVSGADTAFETESRDFSVNFRTGDMVNSEASVSRFFYNGTENIGQYTPSPSSTGSDTQTVEVPLVQQNQTDLEYNFSLDYNATKFSGGTEIRTENSSGNQTIKHAFFYNNSVFEDGLTQLEASTLDFEAKIGKQVSNSKASLSADSTLQQTGETRTLEQNGLNFTGIFDTDLINSTSTTTNLDTTVTVSFDGDTRTFSNTDTLTLEKIQLTKSSSTGPKTLQFETRDEIDNSLLDANMEAGITVNNPDQPEKTRFFGFDFSKDKKHELFLSPSDATITANVFEDRSITYENIDAGFPKRRHYFQDTTLDNETTFINLYLLEQTKGSTVRLELTNSDLQGLSNHLIRVERAFPDQNETRTVQLAKTGTEGFASTFLQLQERYIFTVFDENGDLVDQVGPETVTTSDKRIQVNDGIDPSLANVLNEVQFTDIKRANQSLSVSYVSETQRLNNLFLKISSDGLFETKTLDVDSSEQPQGQLEVTDFNASEQKVFFELIGTFGETNLTLESGTFGQESNDFGNAGIFVSFLMFTALTLSGLFRPSAAIGLGVISIFVMSFTGFLAVGQQALISIAALAAVLIWRMSSQ